MVGGVAPAEVDGPIGGVAGGGGGRGGAWGVVETERGDVGPGLVRGIDVEFDLAWPGDITCTFSVGALRMVAYLTGGWGCCMTLCGRS